MELDNFTKEMIKILCNMTQEKKKGIINMVEEKFHDAPEIETIIQYLRKF